MSTVENVSSMLMVIAISIFILLFVALSYRGESDLKQSNALYQKKYSQIDSMFSTILLLTEPQSEMQFNILLGALFYERSDEINTPYGTYNVEDTLGNMLDYYFGKGKYYFEAHPLITDVKIYFVIDGSATMGPMREYLKTELPVRLSELDEKYDNIVPKIYILSDQLDVCDGFDANMPCEIVSDLELYEDNDARITDPFGGVETPMFSRSTYAESDWASGAAYAAFHNNQFSPSRIELIVPIADEVALGTKEDICLTQPNLNRGSSLSKIACFYCAPKTNFVRSNAQVKTATDVIKEYKQIVMPINALKANYSESSTTYDYLKEKFGSVPDDSVSSTFCGSSFCQGCIDCSNCNSKSVCTNGNCPGCPSECKNDKAYWHPEGFSILNEQFFNISDSTGGNSYTIDDFDEMITYIDETIGNFISNLELKIGEDKVDESYIGFSKVIPHPLANDAYMEIRFKYYEDEVFDLASLEYDIAPIVSEYNLDTSDPSTFNFRSVIKDDNYEQKVILNLRGEEDEFNTPLDYINTETITEKFYHTYEKSFDTDDFASSSYDLSMVVEDESGRQYKFKNLQLGIDNTIICACDITPAVCDTGCTCDPLCTDDLPEQFFWHNKDGTTWDSDDGTDYLPPVRNQGSCGSCWSFALLGATEGKYNIEQNTPTGNLDLSEQDLVSCATEIYSGLYGCSGASVSGGISQGWSYVEDPGVQLESQYPYTGADTACASGSPSYKVDSWSYVPSSNVKDWKRGIIENGPMLVAIAMTDWLSPPVGTCIGNSLDHAVTLVGYDQVGWIIRNSWGPINYNNHHRGYFRVNYNDCGMTQVYPDYAIGVHEV